MSIELFDVLTFDHQIVESVDITTTDPDWTDLITLTTPTRSAGIYGATLSLQFTLNSTSQSFIYHVSTDGGATWGPDYQKEVKDRSNIEVIELLDLIDHPADGPIDIRCQVTRESTATCSVIRALLTCERKG